MTPDQRAAAVAARQHGLVTLTDLLRCGFSEKAVRTRLRRGSIVRLHHKVFGISGSPETWERRALAAVLAAGDAAIASHWTAARLWELPIVANDRVDVTVPIERQPRIADVRVHRSGMLVDAWDRAIVKSIPVTTPARSLVDLSASLDDRQLGRAVDDALRRNLVGLTALHGAARRHGRAPGRSPTRMHRVLAARVPDYDPGDSDLETTVWTALGRAGLPLPRRRYELTVAGRAYVLDMAYRRERIAIEVDGFDFHRGREAFDKDRDRQNALVLAGWTILRFTSRSTEDGIVSTVRRALDVCAQGAP
jgi:very-short-patch-repair endonuclease